MNSICGHMLQNENVYGEHSKAELASAKTYNFVENETNHLMFGLNNKNHFGNGFERTFCLCKPQKPR